MNPIFLPAIQELQEQMKPLEQQLVAKKKLINQLCEVAGEPLMFPDISEVSQINSQNIRSDQFFGRPLATVVREILEPRKAQNKGAISLDELFEKLKTGGYQFDNKNEQIAKRNVAITLSKNSSFIKVPNTGAWGLSEWYPGAKRNKPAESNAGTDNKDTPIEVIPVESSDITQTSSDVEPTSELDSPAKEE